LIKAVIFDFFGVLAMQGAGSFRKNFYPEDNKKLAKHRQLQDLHHAGKMGYNEFIDELAKLGDTDRDTVLKFTEQYEPNYELLDYIRENLNKHYKLGIISNAGSDVVTRLLGKKYGGLFDDAVLSYKVRMIKPEPEIYELSAKNLGVITSECIFIDDISTYCEGAERTGMSSIWYRNFEQFQKELKSLLAASSND
jgi:putative hydrolase of the HAD superfamily